MFLLVLVTGVGGYMHLGVLAECISNGNGAFLDKSVHKAVVFLSLMTAKRT